MPDRRAVCARLARALRPGGGLLIEDLCMRAPFSQAALREVREVVCGATVTSAADYAAELRDVGLVDVPATDLTADWAPYAQARLTEWRAGRADYARVHGEAAYAAQERFYAVIARLYEGGGLGGVRLTGRRAP